MLAVQGPRAREVVQALADSPLPPRMTAAEGRFGGARVLVCGTGYTGEDGVELLLAPADAPRRVGRARAPRRRCPPASPRATRCAWRRAFTSTATTSSLERGPIEAGLGWCCKEDTGFLGADAVRAVRAAGPGRAARRVRARRPRDRPAGQPRARRRRRDQRHALALPWGRDRPRLRARRARRRGHPTGDRRAGPDSPRDRAREAALPARRVGSYPAGRGLRGRAYAPAE